MKSPVKNYLSITKKEWNGMVVLVVIIAIILAAPTIYQQFRKDSTINLKQFNKDVATLQQAGDMDTTYNANTTASSDEKNPHPVMFNFDPNNLPDEKWKQLGLSDHQISIIKHFESKGGHFYKKEDVKKIYSITPEDYLRLEPFISIAGVDYVTDKVKPGVVIELNTAESARLTKIRGIGPAFAQRIAEYRSRLGGFLNKDQLKEIYGIDTTKFAQIKNEVSVDPSHITKIKINDVDFEGLRKFPYFTNKQTNAVIQYRKQHGNYQSLADMKNIVLLNDDILRKIEPYIDFK